MKIYFLKKCVFFSFFYDFFLKSHIWNLINYISLNESKRFLYPFKVFFVGFKKIYKIKIISTFMWTIFTKINFFSKLKIFRSHFEGTHKFKNNNVINNILIFNDWQLSAVNILVKSFEIFWKMLNNIFKFLKFWRKIKEKKKFKYLFNFF